MILSYLNVIINGFKKHWDIHLPLWKIVVYDYVLLRVMILICIPASFWIFGRYSQETFLNILTILVVPLFLLVVLSWCVIWRNTVYSTHKYSTYLLRGLVIAEALAILWFTEVASFS